MAIASPLFSALVLATIALSAPTSMPSIESRDSPMIDPSTFAANSSFDVAAIYAAAIAANKTKVASYATTSTQDHFSTIYADWQHLEHVSVFHFMADMDIDCDGTDYDCAGNSGGDSETSFGALDARKVPWFVLPETLQKQEKDAVKDNALGAIICDGKMFYAIFGDQNGATPQVIGEGSLLLGHACFPKDRITGNNRHAQRDVAYLVFGNQPLKPTPDGSTIDISALKKLGDQQVKLLVQDLQL
ncbi:fungal chitosanase of glycosyl hydrolase group 75-domain-containing protein [Mycena alexandri]|uniref:Endo-chitosanase n=1 Tax=Mycena alexandri TaxID=1745969 RepID=A0AAD6X7Q2_9AGAR|nr:fungal chitosanase of glycosyl hydrolase group 75-domain-containing protein [Mycena alexandri]